MFGQLPPEHIQLFEYWQQKAGQRRMPSRSDIRPEEMPSLLKMIGLIDVAPGPRFRYRLIGTQMNLVFGEDYTGKWLDEAKSGPYRDFLQELYAEASEYRRPVYSRTDFEYRDGRRLEVRRLILPLAADGENVNMLLFSNRFRADSATLGIRPFLASDIVTFFEDIRRAA